MKANPFVLAVVAGLALQAAQPAAAQNALTLYGGYRGGGSFQQTVNGNANNTADLASGGAGALSFDGAVDAARTAQLFASTQRSTLHLAAGSNPSSVPLNITYLHLGGTNFFEGKAGEGAYLSGGLGVTYLSPQQSELSSEVRPSMSIGLGYELPLASSLSLRMEVRGFATLINSSGGFFCNGGCVVVIRGDGLVQADALVGLSLRF